MVDGDLLPRRPGAAIADGEARDIALMASVCRDEYHFFQYAGPMAGFPSVEELRRFDEAEILRRFQRALPRHGQQALSYYQRTVTPDPQRSNMDWFSAMETDRLFRVPTLRLLDAQAAHRDAVSYTPLTLPTNREVEAQVGAVRLTKTQNRSKDVVTQS